MMISPMIKPMIRSVMQSAIHPVTRYHCTHVFSDRLIDKSDVDAFHGLMAGFSKKNFASYDQDSLVAPPLLLCKFTQQTRRTRPSQTARRSTSLSRDTLGNLSRACREAAFGHILFSYPGQLQSLRVH